MNLQEIEQQDDDSTATEKDELESKKCPNMLSSSACNFSYCESGSSLVIKASSRYEDGNESKGHK